jgi:hypothetical protein
VNSTEQSQPKATFSTNTICKNLRRCAHSARHPRAVVRHVERLGGPARNLCRECFRQILATETRDALAARWRGLFRHLRPWVYGLRGAVSVSRAGATDGRRRQGLEGAIEALADRLINYLLARAILAAYRDRSHKPFIALARVVARIAEGRSDV